MGQYIQRETIVIMGTILRIILTTKASVILAYSSSCCNKLQYQGGCQNRNILLTPAHQPMKPQQQDSL